MDRGQVAHWIVAGGKESIKFREQLRDRYEKNRKALLAYRLWLGGDLPEWDGLHVRALRLGKGNWSYFDEKSKRIGPEIRIRRTERPIRPFFQDLEKPLLVKDEMNLCHWEYLYDNVRRSEDYGGDNHIYMHFGTMEAFLLLLQAEDITSCLPMEKFVFLFGQEGLERHYPLDFSRYGIDCGSMERRPVQASEIQRIFVNLHYFSEVGNDFFYGVQDWHKDLLTMGQRGLPEFVYVHDQYLHGRTVRELEEDYFAKNMEPLVYRAFSIMLGDTAPQNTQITDRPDPDDRQFFAWMRKLWPTDDPPSQPEWLKLLYLAYAYAMGRQFLSRIAPGIMFNTHFNVQKMVDKTRWKKNFALFRRFKYCAMILPVRRPIVAVSAIHAYHLRKGTKKDINYMYSFFQTYFTARVNRLFEPEEDWGKKLIRVVRFEDMKMHSKAMLASLCEYFDIEWDDMLLRVTYNGKDVVFDKTGGYDPAPVHKRYFEMCNPFDYYRLEAVLSKYWRHFGYEPLFYQGNIAYSREEIHRMFDITFQFETIPQTEKGQARNGEARQRMHALLDEWMDEGDCPRDAQGKAMLPLPWLKPKQELLDCELYR